MTAPAETVRIGPCRVCQLRRDIEVSAPGFPGGLTIGCPRCTLHGALQLLALITRGEGAVLPDGPGGAA